MKHLEPYLVSSATYHILAMEYILKIESFNVQELNEQGYG